MSTETCEWTIDANPDFTVWETTCGQAFVFEVDGPEHNGMKFCCYCGKPLVEVRITDCEVCDEPLPPNSECAVHDKCADELRAALKDDTVGRVIRAGDEA